MRKALAVCVTTALLVSLLATAAPARTAPEAGDGRVDPGMEALLATLAPAETTTVIVVLRGRADLAAVRGATRSARLRGVIDALQATARTSQAGVRALLRARAAQGRVTATTPFWVVDGISVTATAEVIRELAARPDVASITPDDLPVLPAYGSPEPNLAAVDAPALWDLGYTGQGVVVASLDSGVDASHPDLASRWRGGTNSWFDPYGEHPTTPTDLSGHGTATMGVIVGGDAGGTSIGMAPGASWIAAKIFDDRGGATATAIHQAYQWVLDPDQDPATDDAPQVVNNSWSIGAGPGCDLSFQPDLQALRAAGILPVFAAGNYGPSGSSSVSPANYPEALAVGAVDGSDLIYSAGSRGPSTCGGRSGVFPDLVAPGVDIDTTDRYGFYQTVTGTSLSAPHAAGALALLLGAVPGLSPDAQHAALTTTAVDLGPPGPDSAYGHGRLDVLAAYHWLQGQPDFTVSVTPTSATLAVGESVSLTIAVDLLNGFSGTVTLTVDGLPAGVSASLSPATLDSAGTAQLDLSMDYGAPTGTYQLTIAGTGGATTHAVPVTLTLGGGDVVGPVTTSASLVPGVSNGTGSAGVAVHATGDDTASGGSTIVAGEYSLDAGAGVPLTVNVAAPIASLDGTIPAAVVNALAEGLHVVAIRSQDQAGNWGPAVTVDLVVDKTGPDTSGVSAAPSPNNGTLPFNASTPAVRLMATTLSDPVAGGVRSTISGAEAFIDTVGTPGTGIPLAAGDGAFTSALESGYTDIPLATVAQLSNGNHTLYVRAKDAAGNWGPTASTVLVIDKVPPSVLSINRADPNPTSAATVTFLVTFSENVTGVSAGNFTLATGPGLTGAAITSVTGSGTTRTVTATTGTGGGGTLGLNLTSPAGITDPAGNTLSTTGLPFVGQVYTQPTPPLYFSTLGNTNPPGLGGTADDADIYLWNGTAFSRSVDVTALSTPLPAGANVDGFDRLSATQFYASFTGAVTIAVPGPDLNVQDEDVVYYNAGTWSLFFDGSANGVGATDLDAISLLAGQLYFSTGTTLVPPGAAGTGDDADIYRWNGATSYTRVADASALGWSTANVDGLLWQDPTHLYLSYSADTTAPGIGAIQDEDVIGNNGGTWSVYFNGTARGLTTANLDVDAFDLP